MYQTLPVKKTQEICGSVTPRCASLADLADTPTSSREPSALGPPPLITSFQWVSDYLSLASGSWTSRSLHSVRMHPRQQKFAEGEHPDAEHCRAVRCRDRPVHSWLCMRHLHRAASEPVAWQVFFVVGEQSQRQPPTAEAFVEDACYCTGRTPSTTPSTNKRRATCPLTRAHDPMRIVVHVGIRMLVLLSFEPTRPVSASPSIAGGGGVRLPGGCPSGSVPHGT